MAARKRRRGSREEKRARAAKSATVAPYISRQIPTYCHATEEQLALVEHNADTVLEEIGIEFRDFPRALELFKEAGAEVTGELVRFPRGLCREIIQKNAPSQFTQHARNPAKSVVIGGNNTVLVPAYGSPFVRDIDNGRRYANIEDFQNFVKLAYLSPAAERAEDTVAMSKILFGDDFIDTETGKEKTVVINLINANSPMTFDDTMLGAAEVYAKANQATVVSPFILAGAMSPVTVVGTVTQILAEALAGMAFVQLVRPGAPVVFGTFASSVSMQSGAPTFGTPEPSSVLYIAAELARRLGVPFRSGGGLNASKLPDAQAAFEAANTLQAAMLAGVNFMLHTAGWLEGGLVMSYEKFVLCVKWGLENIFSAAITPKEILRARFIVLIWRITTALSSGSRKERWMLHNVPA